MSKEIDLAKLISKDTSIEYKDLIYEYNLPDTFSNIYSIASDMHEANVLICFIIYAYSPDSLWLDLKKDRLENKLKILHNLDADINSEIVQSVINGDNEIAGIAIFDFLEELKSWRWRTIFDLLDYSSRMSRFATQVTEAERRYQKINKEGEVRDVIEELDIDVISKVNKEKGMLLDQSIAKRKQADVLLEEIRKEYVTTDQATQQDFGFIFTDTSKKRDILSWRAWIDELNDRKKKAAN